MQKLCNLMLINVIIRNGKVIGAYNIGFMFAYLAYKVYIVLTSTEMQR